MKGLGRFFILPCSEMSLSSSTPFSKHTDVYGCLLSWAAARPATLSRLRFEAASRVLGIVGSEGGHAASIKKAEENGKMLG